MAKLTLSDGRTVDIVKPHLGDQMELELQMRETRKGYGAADFRRDMSTSGFQTAFAVWATLRREGIPQSIHDVLTLDFGELGKVLHREASDSIDEESEGEQEPHPPSAPTAAADPE